MNATARDRDRPFLLADLYFGKDDAESDIAAGGLLERGFLETSAFIAVSTGRKSLIIGRKGSGKSAICVVLDRRRVEGNVHYSLVTPDEISSEEVRRFELPGITEAQAKTLLWRYVLDVQIAKFLLTASQQDGKSIPESLRPVRKFLVDNNEVDDLRFTEKLWRVIEKLKASLSLEAFGLKVGVEAGIPSEGVRVSSEIETLERGLNDAYRSAQWPGRDPSLILMVDQLERVWANDRNSDHMVVGLLQASKHVGACFRFASAAVFVRTDIYDFLQFQDRDKYRGDEHRMDWSGGHLEQLLVARAEASLNQPISAKQLWTQVFPPKINGEHVKDYLLSRTLLRPRDIIQFCNLCRDTAEKNCHKSIHETDVLEATAQYSSWKLRDLIAEYLVNYPFLNDLFVLFQNSSYVGTKPSLDSRLRTVRDALARRYPDHQAVFHVDGVLEVIYSIGFLGVLRPSGVSYAFKGATGVGPADETFIIHPAFRDALRSTSSLDLRPIDMAKLRRRIESESSAVGTEMPIVRGLRERPARFLADRCERIIDGFLKSALPAEVKSEVRQNLHEFVDLCRELFPYGGRSDLVFAELASEVIDYLQSLRVAVESSGLDARECTKLARQLDDSVYEIM